ncbi:MAG: lipopolysaccharide biosynthesis protein [Fibrobacter sp.]|nr:lipopolysaccharide biosynthesis protein [Fibrobacter sp.]
MSTQFKEKAIKGFAWNTVEKIGVYAIRFIIGIILARILMPSDYGVIGMLAIFFAISELFVRSGFSEALIQRKDRTEVDYSTVFYFNLIVAVLFYIILFFSAPLIAKFYNVKELTLLTRVLSLNIIINALALVQQTKLTIRMDFKSQALISLFSVIISGPIGIFAALKGFGVWALVLQNIAGSLIRTFLLFYFNSWVPSLVFSLSSFKSLFGFSSKLLGAGLIATTFNNIYSMLIGKIFSAQELGYYTKARQFPELISNTLVNILQGVTFPILASLQDKKEHMISVYSRVMRGTVFLIIPGMTIFALIAGPFIRIFLTDKWAPVIPLLQWLCFSRMITPVSSLNMNILNAIGRSDLFLKVDIIKIPLAIATLIITVPLGLKAIVIGNFINTLVNFFINTYYPAKLFGFGPLRQIKEMKSVLLSTAIMSVMILAVMPILPSDILKFSICIPLSVGIFLILAYVFKINELHEFMGLLRTFMNKRI